MENKVKRTFHAYIDMSPDERDQFHKILEQYRNRARLDQLQINEATNKEFRDLKVQTGPLGGDTCPYCGR
jgi:hypothetical protein